LVVETLEQERKQREEQERKQREEQERKQREEQERIQREEQERKEREEQERIQREEQERIQREEQERIQREEQERIQREEQEKRQREEEERRREEENKRAGTIIDIKLVSQDLPLLEKKKKFQELEAHEAAKIVQMLKVDLNVFDLRKFSLSVEEFVGTTMKNFAEFSPSEEQKQQVMDILKKLVNSTMKVVNDFIPRPDVEYVVKQFKDDTAVSRKQLLDILLFIKNFVADTSTGGRQGSNTPITPQSTSSPSTSSPSSQPSTTQQNAAPPSRNQALIHELESEPIPVGLAISNPKAKQKLNYKDIVDRMKHPQTGVSIKDRKANLLKTYKDCFTGSESVDWMVFHLRLPNREEAVLVGQSLMASGLVNSPSNEAHFVDSEKHFYIFIVK